MNIIAIHLNQPGTPPILAGRLDGKRMFARGLESLPTIKAPTVVALDFAGIELATSSFLDEAVVRFRDHLRIGRSLAYLVVANMNDKVEEELHELLSRGSDAMLSCTLTADGKISHLALIGALEPKLSETLELVKQKGGATAVELHGETEDTKKIGPTAWNNRLNTLAAKSLVMEVQQSGRTKKYQPILESA